VSLSDGAEEEATSKDAALFRRNRHLRAAIGAIASVVLVAAYLLGIQSYRAGLTTDFPTPDPPSGGVALVLVPERLLSQDGEMPTEVLLFPSAELFDEGGVLTIDVDVTI
jgi:hypothetical protein